KNGLDFDWWDAIVRSGSIQNHNLSMQWGTDKTSYFISTGYTNQEGILIGDDYDRLSFRINIENKILDWFKMGINSFISATDYSGLSPAIQAAYLNTPFVTPYNDDGTLNIDPMGIGRGNPLMNSTISDLDKGLNINGTLFAKIDVPFAKGLSYQINVANNLRTGRKFQFNQYGDNYRGSSLKTNSYAYDRTIDNIINYNRTFLENH